MRPNNARPSTNRFAVALELRYKASSSDMGMFGVGKTQSMNSTEIAFTADHPLQAGMRTEIYIAWPYKLDNAVPLQLVVEGSVIRCEGPLATVRIQKYYYKTRGKWPTAEAHVAAPLQPLPVAQPARALTAAATA